MVGVPRSKGCMTCRKRKIGCSRERPICAQCKSTGRECLGYARQTIFLHNNQQYTIQDPAVVDKSEAADFPEPNNRKIVKSSGSTHSLTEQSQKAVDLTSANDPVFDLNSQVQPVQCVFIQDGVEINPPAEVSSILERERALSRDLVTQTTALLPLTHQEPSLPGDSPSSFYNQSLMSSFTRRQILSPFFELAARSPAPLGRGPRAWTSIIPYLQNPEPSLELSVLALASARMGISFNNEQLIHQSLKLYGQGLKAMQRALWDPKRMYSDQVLGACVLLTMYEVMECPSQSRVGYVSHHNGCARLIELRGPEAHKSGLGHAIFLQFRYISAMEALVSKHTFLSRPEWKKIPWEIEEREILDEFLDVFLDGVQILWEAEALDQTTTPKDLIVIAVTLIKKCWIFDRQLEEFYENLKKSYGKPLFWPVITSVDEPHSDSLASTHFEFAEPKIATTLMLYWATLTVLWSGMARIYNGVDELAEVIIPSIKASSPSTISMGQIYTLLGLPERGRSKDFIAPARKVCQGVNFCFQNELSMRVVIPPLTMVADTLKPWKKYTEELDFVKKRLDIVQKRGVKIIPYISDLHVL